MKKPEKKDYPVIRNETSLKLFHRVEGYNEAHEDIFDKFLPDEEEIYQIIMERFNWREFFVDIVPRSVANVIAKRIGKE